MHLHLHLSYRLSYGDLFLLSENGTVAVSAVVGVNIETMTGIEGSASHLLAMNLALHKSACGETGEVALLSFLTLSSLRPQPSFPAESWLLPCLGHPTHTAFLCPIYPLGERLHPMCAPLSALSMSWRGGSGSFCV